MDAVDGNAIGGLLIDVFGTEMTAADSTCGTCGASRPVAELVVYQRAPGTVVRCRTCGSVLMVFVRAHDVMCVSLAGLATLGELAGINTTEGAVMSHEESMSMGTPQEEPMMMQTPHEESMSMGTPQEEPMMMRAPDEEPMMMRAPDEEPMTMRTPDE
jgi:hypothetical protein